MYQANPSRDTWSSPNKIQPDLQHGGDAVGLD
jgi:hypothetical protein